MEVEKEQSKRYIGFNRLTLTVLLICDRRELGIEIDSISASNESTKPLDAKTIETNENEFSVLTIRSESIENLKA